MYDNIKRIISFRLEDGFCGINIMSAQEIIKMHYIRKLPNTPYFLEGMLNLRGDVIPVVNLKKLFKFTSFDFIKGKSIVILRFDKDKFGIVIDKILRVVPVDSLSIKDVPTNFPEEFQKYILGVVEEQGNIISILDINGIAKLINEKLNKTDIANNKNINYKQSSISPLNLVEEKEIYLFLRNIGFKLNIVTDIGIRNYFAKLKIKYNKPINQVIQKVKQNINEEKYNPFSKKKNDRFFDNENDFYALLNLFEQVIMPNKKHNKKLRILNISCGRGFDIYSILFMLKSYVSKEEWHIDFIATDDDPRNLQYAKEANYNIESLEKINKNNYTMLFDEKEKGLFSIKEEFKNIVDFQSLSLDDYINIPIKNIDLCFVRGQLVNLNKQDIANLLTAICKALDKNAILFLSEIEDLYFFDNLPLIKKEIDARKYYVHK